MLDGLRRADAREVGQTLVLFAAGLVAFIGLVSMSIDVGSILVEKRELQNAVDAAALAGAQDLMDGLPAAAVEVTALDYMGKNGFPITGATTLVNVPPSQGPYAGQSGYVEVTSVAPATTWFLQLFMSSDVNVSARAVAEGRMGVADTVSSGTCSSGGAAAVSFGDKKDKKDKDDDDDDDDDDGDTGGGGGTGGCTTGTASAAPPMPVSQSICSSPSSTLVVDGRRMDSEGYSKLGDLLGGATDYGDVFYGCDGTYLHFAMVLNGPGTGGAVANENTYGPGPKTKPPGPDYHGIHGTGWVKKHDFKALIKSDRARFLLACDGVPVHDFVQDYLRDDLLAGGWISDAAGDGEVVTMGPTSSASSLEWNLEHPSQTGWGDDAGEDPLVQSPPFTPMYPTYSSEYDGWIWEMIYEFKVPIADYAACTGPIMYGNNSYTGTAGPLEGIHSSPAKFADAEFLVIGEPAVLRLVE